MAAMISSGGGAPRARKMMRPSLPTTTTVRLMLFAFGFQRVVGAGHLQSFVDQEIEGQLLLLDERQVTGGVRLIDPVGLGVDGAKRVDGAAHGGELVRSAGSAVGRVEEERGAPFAA